MSIFSINGLDIPLDINVLPVETVQLAEAASRIAAEDVLALYGCPPHSESLRDGYVLAAFNPERERDASFPVVGEIAAGARNISRLQPGSACRIFTGGLIPEGGLRVVPQEECHEVAGRVRIAETTLASERLFINMAGSEMKAGETVVFRGTRLEIDHLMLLAAVGVDQMKVIARPRVACFYTGSELVAVGGRLETGQKLSLNSLLLQNIIPHYGGIITEQGIIADTPQALAGIFNTLTNGQCDLVVSTGGMGPGKYDLVKNAFSATGGRIILETLPMHPGRSILLGILGGTVFIALPGPPHAVRTLVNELVGPLVLMMQGAQRYRPRALHARLSHNLRVRRSDLLQIKGGVLAMEQGRCMVRLAERLEPVSCFILFPPGRKEFAVGDVVEVHLAATIADSGIFHL
ncbi:MAG: molybdopterin molybdotransferase MoeA [Pseudomonadota bacterium]